MKHKTEDYKISAVKYYLETQNSMDAVCDIFGCSKTSLYRWIEKYKTQHNITRNNRYRGEERPVCFKPAKIGVIPRKSDKRPKACDSPLQPC